MIRGLEPSTIERRIRAYESFGIHRTGWPGDDRSAEWMVEELSDLGIEAATERFAFPRVELRAARLTWPDGSTEGVPLYDGGFTRPGGVRGPLVDTDADEIFGKIVVAGENDRDFGQRRVYDGLERLERAGAVGLVLPRRDPDGEVVVLNAERIDAPFRLPVLQVPANGASGLASATMLGVDGTIEIDGDRLESHALNVVASLPGTEPGAAPIGIMTPRSGWFTCAAERGGGIAILLALAEAVQAMADRRRTVHLVASSGHELHHCGLSAYLGRRPGIEREPVAWLHLGANIGSSTAPVHAESVDPELHALAGASLTAEGALYDMVDVRGGEAVNIHEGGGRYISLRGGNTFFHSPNDVFDRASDPALVAAAGRASLRIVEAWLKP